MGDGGVQLRNARAAPRLSALWEKMVAGGRVELPTPAFSGPRSTGELPRHRKNTNYTEIARNVKTHCCNLVQGGIVGKTFVQRCAKLLS